MSSLNSSYWCYQCSRAVSVRQREGVTCPECGGGVLERVNARAQMAQSMGQQPSPPLALSESAQRVPTSTSARRAVGGEPQRNRLGEESAPAFRPLIFFRDPEGHPDSGTTSFDLYYDAGRRQGFRPLPQGMSPFLRGSGLERLLGQLEHVGASGGREHRPASKSVVDGLPTIKVEACHVDGEWQCAICLEMFEIDSSAREMPCKHLYHSDCILPWLSLHNSCPVCRHQLPTDDTPASQNAADSVGADEEDQTMGFTIWRIPGGGYAVGRLSDREREITAASTETEVDLNAGAVASSRTAAWISANFRGTGGRLPGSEVWHAIRGFFSFFGIGGSPSTAPRRRRSMQYSGNFNSNDRNQHQPPAVSRPWRHHREWAFMERSGQP